MYITSRVHPLTLCALAVLDCYLAVLDITILLLII